MKLEAHEIYNLWKKVAVVYYEEYKQNKDYDAISMVLIGGKSKRRIRYNLQIHYLKLSYP